MQQVQKDRGANKRFPQTLILLFILSFFSLNTYGQNVDFDFQKSVIKTLKYPESLRQSCTSTYTNILIETNQEGLIINLSVSDSAPKLFKDEFNTVKSLINLEPLKAIIKRVKVRYIILPVFYVYASDYCVNSFEAAGYISDNYYYFDGNRLDSPAYNLKPIINIIYKPLH